MLVKLHTDFLLEFSVLMIPPYCSVIINAASLFP